MKDRFKLLLKILVSLTCLMAVFFIVNVEEVPGLLKKLRAEDIALALTFMIIGHLGSGLRFHFIINKLGRTLDRVESIKVSFVALWFNQILPTGSGGDLVRGVLLTDRCGLIRSVLSVMLDRILGLLWMILIVLIFLPIVLHDKIADTTIVLVMGTCFGILITGLLPILSGKNLCKLFPGKTIYKLCRLISLFGFSARQVLSLATIHKLIFFLCLSFFPYVFYVSVIGNSFGLDISLLEYVALVPILFIAMNFPISVGGWGVRELTSIYVFSYTGMSEELAIIISVLYGLGLIITSIPGNLFWLYKKPLSQMQES